MADSSASMTNSEVQSTANSDWSIDQSAEIYGINQWGGGYFRINESGCVTVDPTAKGRPGVDLKQLVDDLRERDLYPPILLRFSDILHDRIAKLHQTFSNAIEEFNYKGKYHTVYPIKVNQQRHVVEEIKEFGKKFECGLEAGSKPELLAVMALVEDADTPIICNGFKDSEFIETVILATKIGKNIIPVVESFNELRLIALHAKSHNVTPRIGMRVKLSTRGAGRWESSAGDRSKFGLFVSELLQAVDFLHDNGLQDCLKLLHVHLGSQINNIQNIKAGVTELSRIYTELQKAGAKLEYVDVGGGLGVDYDGNKSNTDSSVNYTLQEYANDIVYHIGAVCDDEDVPHPSIITESGRAVVAHHSVLITSVMQTFGINRPDADYCVSDEELAEMPQPAQLLYESWRDISEANLVEYYHDSIAAREQVMSLFNLGYCSLAHRALAERLFFGICSRAARIISSMESPPTGFDSLESFLAETYICNLSIFQSMPDSWAIDQLFPIMPIHRLTEEPVRRGTLADITCDSDGKIDHFIQVGEQTGRVLPLHTFDEEQTYDLGVFLVGAYQEILGDLHNLFGDTHAVHITVNEDGQPMIDEVVEGDSVGEVLSYVQFSIDDLKRSMRQQVENALRKNTLDLAESRQLLRFYESGLEGYTYLE